MLYIVGVAISFFLSLILFGKKGRSAADLILAVWLAVSGLHLGCYYLLLSGMYKEYPCFLGLELPMPLLHGPFLYLYTRKVTGNTGRKYDWLHFIPYAGFLLVFSGFIFSSGDYKVNVYQQSGAPYRAQLDLLMVSLIISGVSYALASLIALHRHRQAIKDCYSNTDQVNLRWLTGLIAGMSVIWISVIAGTDQVTFGIVTFFIFYIGYFGIKQVGIFTNNSSDTPEPALLQPVPVSEQDPETSVKYARSGLSSAEIQRIHQQLKAVVADEKPFKDAELTIAKLADRLNVHPNVLSQVINSCENQNFFDYINTLRVNEFITCAGQPDSRKYTLLALALECGFNSKSSFNRNFKKVTGQAPTDFLRGDLLRASD